MFFAVFCIDDNEVVLVTDIESVAEILVGQLEEDDIRDSGCEKEYEIYRVPFYHSASPRITVDIDLDVEE